MVMCNHNYKLIPSQLCSPPIWEDALQCSHLSYLFTILIAHGVVII
uniref:Uncharacterized protein n=1 Tax=Anguilla anguilla TaxID=7936 RepID=A0A0E9WBC5_ANGAN